MDLTRKSMKWLVAVLVVFALVLTAVFASGTMATASADDPQQTVVTSVSAKVTGTQTAGDPTHLINTSAWTITVEYYYDMTGMTGTMPGYELIPYVLAADGETVIRPTDISVNSYFDEYVDLDSASSYYEGADPQSDSIVADIKLKDKTLAYFDGVDANGAAIADKYLYTATYTIAANSAAGFYQLIDASEFTPQAIAYVMDLDEDAGFNLCAPVAIPVADDLTYIGSEQIPLTDTNDYTVTGDAQTDVGDYTLTVSLAQEFTCWEDGTVEDIEIDWSILKATVPVPVIDTTSSAFDGQENDVGYYNYDGETHEIYWTSASVLDSPISYGIPGAELPGTKNATDAGTYNVEVNLTDPDNYEWETIGGTDTLTYTFIIKQAVVSKDDADAAVLGSTVTYNTEAQTYSGSGEGYTYTSTGTNVGNYDVTISLASANYIWDDDTTESFTATNDFVITPMQIEKPTNSNVYEYDGTAHSFYVTPSDWYGFDFSETKTNVSDGIDNVAISLTDTANTEWSDGTTESFTIPFEISAKTVTLTFVNGPYSTTFGETLATISVTANGLIDEDDLGEIGYAVTKNLQPAVLGNVGEYSLTATYTANSNYVVEGGTSAYTILAKTVTKPAADNTNFVYNGEDQTYTLATSSDYTITGTTTKTNAGSNTITVALNDKDNTVWSTGGTADVEYTFTIAKFSVVKPEQYSQTYTYNGNTQYCLIIVDEVAAGYFQTTNNSRVNAGSQTVYNTLYDTDNTQWSDGTTAPIEFTFTINVKKVAIPATSGDTAFDYDGTEKSLTFTNTGDAAWYDIANNALTEPGSVTVTATLKAEHAGNIEWTDETTEVKEYTLTVNVVEVSVKFSYTYGNETYYLNYANETFSTVDEADWEAVSFNVLDAIPATPAFRYFATLGFKVDGTGSVVTEISLDMVGDETVILDAAYTYNVGAGDMNGDGKVTTYDLAQMKLLKMGLIDSEVLVADADAAWALRSSTGTFNKVFSTAKDVNNDNRLRINDITAVRAALATGYDFRIVAGLDVTGQSIRSIENPEEVATLDALRTAVRAGLPAKLIANITEENEDFDEEVDLPAEIDLNGFALTVNYFSLTSDEEVTLTVKGGTLYVFDDIVITAPNGNVNIDNVTGYNFITDEVILAAATNSLHFDGNVAFLKYPGGDLFADKIAAMTTITALSSEDVEEKQVAEAAIAEAPAAPVSIPVDTHVVVEEAATLTVEKIAVVEAQGSNENANTFSINVKNTTTQEAITVDITAVKDDAYVVENVDVTAVAGNVSVVAGENTDAKVNDMVAEIGGKGYKTLQDAIDAAVDGDVIVLLKNVADGTGLRTADDNTAKTKVGKSFTIDFNGKTYTVNGAAVGSSNTETQAMHWGIKDTITLKNGTFVVSEDAVTIPNPVTDKTVKMAMQNYAKLTVKDMIMDFSNIPTSSYGEHEFEANGPYFKYNGLEDPKFNVNENGWSSMYVEGSTITLASDSTKGINVEVAGTIFKNSTINGSICLSGDGLNASVTLINTTATKGVVGYFATDAVVQDGNTYSFVEAAASYNGKGYATLQDAINAVPVNTPSTVTLLKNVTNGGGIAVPDGYAKTVTIDFNGKTYTVTGPAVGSQGTESQAMHFAIVSNVTLQNGTFVVAHGATGVQMGMQSHGALTVNNMTIDMSEVPFGHYGTYTEEQYVKYNGLEIPVFNANQKSANSSLTIIGSTVTLPDTASFGVYIEVANAVITDSTINGSVALSSDTIAASATITNSTVTKGVVAYFAKDAVTNSGDVYTLALNTTLVSTEAELRAALAAGAESIILNADIEVTGSSMSNRLKITKSMIVDLNGYSIKSADGLEPTNNWSTLWVDNGANVTIMNGTIGSCYDSNGTTQSPYGITVGSQYGSTETVLNLYDVEVYGGCHAVYVMRGTANIYSGTYAISPWVGNANPYGFVLNCLDKNYNNGSAIINVYGGTFDHFNPADNVAETGGHTNFVADGYAAFETVLGDYTVMEDSVIVIKSFEELADAIDEVNAGTLVDPVLYIAVEEIAFEYELMITKSVTILGEAGVTRFSGYNVTSSYDDAIFINTATPNQTVVIEGITFDHVGYYADVENEIETNIAIIGSAMSYSKNCAASTSLYLTNCTFWGIGWEFITFSSAAGCAGNIYIEGCEFDATDRIYSTVNLISFYGKTSNDISLNVDIYGCTFKNADKENEDWPSTAIGCYGNTAFTIDGCTFINCEIAITIDNTYYPMTNPKCYYCNNNAELDLGDDIMYINCETGVLYYAIIDAADIPEGAVLVEGAPVTASNGYDEITANKYCIIVAGEEGSVGCALNYTYYVAVE